MRDKKDDKRGLEVCNQYLLSAATTRKQNKNHKKNEKQSTSTNIYYLLLPQPENMSKHKTIKKSTGCPKNGANRIFRELLGGQSFGPP